jgi:hypothetical protein
MAQIPTLTSSSINSRPSFCWYNETSASFIGSLSAIYSPSDGAGFASSMGMSEAIITTTGTTVVSYRIVGAGSLSALGGSSDFSTTGSYPWFDIEVISGNSPLVNGTSGTSGSSGTSGTGVITSPWVSYVVTWSSASSPQPVIGNGSLRGFYTTVGKTVFVRVDMIAGVTTTFGTGAWSFSLPVNAVDADGIQFPCSMLDQGIGWYTGIVNGSYSSSVSSSSIITTSSPAVAVDANNPFNWGITDTLQFNGSYEGI